MEPCTFVAEVHAVTIHFRNKIELPLRVKGKGVISLLYSDKELRIIESEEGARAVQRPVPGLRISWGTLQKCVYVTKFATASQAYTCTYLEGPNLTFLIVFVT